MNRFILTVANGELTIRKGDRTYIKDERKFISSIIEMIKNENFRYVGTKDPSYDSNNVQKFFSWFQEKFPLINRISVKERNELIRYFLYSENGDLDLDISSFNADLPANVTTKKISIRGKACHGYEIKNRMPSAYFREEYKFSQ